MQVWEYINKLKGTNATLDQIKSWSYMNRESPCHFPNPLNALELKDGIPPKFDYFIKKWCNSIKGDCDKCFAEFFELKMPDGFKWE